MARACVSVRLCVGAAEVTGGRAACKALTAGLADEGFRRHRDPRGRGDRIAARGVSFGSTAVIRTSLALVCFTLSSGSSCCST